MTRRRWIADEVAGDRAVLLGEHGAHLARVLRARVGQQFDIVAGTRVRRGTIAVVDVADGRVEFELGEEVEESGTYDVTVLMAVFKFDRMEWAIEKCTELGAARIIPVIASRTEVHLAKAAEKRVERWRRIAVQASEQSRRARPLEISDPAKLTTGLLATCAGERVVLAEAERGLSLGQALRRSGSRVVTLAVGPEGGWTEEELRRFDQSHFARASLGRTILRAETAAIAATTLAMAAIEESDAEAFAGGLDEADERRI